MKEVSFIRRHLDKWKAIENIAARGDAQHPGQLVDAYTEVVADLSFSRSRYPASSITAYLNKLAAALHNQLHKNKKESYARLITFWTREVPEAMYRSRKELLYSFLTFSVSVLIGVLSTVKDDSFARLILGNGYVDMTLDNIADGNPMGVYGSTKAFPMFLAVTFNNIAVSFRAFAMGLFTGFGAGAILFYNGVMVGAFQTFCFQHHAGWESALAIWLHGTFEISAVIAAGAAGFVLGNGWLFPGTYPRGYAFRQGARRGVKIIAGLVPLFVLAGFIESYLTRHTEYPAAARLAMIFFSIAFVIYYYIILPHLKHHDISKEKN